MSITFHAEVAGNVLHLEKYRCISAKVESHQLTKSTRDSHIIVIFNVSVMYTLPTVTTVNYK